MRLITSLSAKTDSLPGQFFRYFLVGGVAFVVDFALLFLLTEFGHIHYLLSASVAFMAGIAANYALSVSWVFDHRSLDNKVHKFAILAVVGILGLAQRITSLAGAPLSLILRPAGDTPPGRYMPYSRYAREELGLKAAINLDDTIARTLAWHMAL